MSLLNLGTDPEHRFTCSRAGCTSRAEWAIRWRNPKIHTAERCKTWLACGDHLDALRGFLESRGFPLEVVTVGELDD